MDLLNIQLTQAKKIKGIGKSKPKDLLIYDIHRNDKKQISMALFKDTYKTFKKKYGEQNLMVRALNDTQWFCFKGFSDPDLEIEDFEDYYENRVVSQQKFHIQYEKIF